MIASSGTEGSLGGTIGGSPLTKACSAELSELTGSRAHFLRNDLMKTIVTTSDSLLDAARRLAAREGVTADALVERGLRRVLAESNQGAPFKLRRASFKGEGLQAELSGASWESLCDLSYEGRGGSGGPRR